MARLARAAAGRMVLPLNRNWRYSSTVVEGAHGREFDDSAFERVVIPHTNIRLPWHSFDDKSYEFVSLYRRRFKLPPEARGKHVFVDFEGVMTASTVWINGVRLGEYKGGYTPFSFDLTPHLDFDGENVLAVDVDSTERPDIPPFGYQIDYLTFGGIYREVSLRIVPALHREHLRQAPRRSHRPSCLSMLIVSSVRWKLRQEPLTLEVDLRDGDRVSPGLSAHPAARRPRPNRWPTPSIWTNSAPSNSGTSRTPISIPCMSASCAEPQSVDRDSRTVGFREAQFTDHGFELNGKVIKLRGLDRHQTFPFVGQAMPGRVQRRDAQILRHKLIATSSALRTIRNRAIFSMPATSSACWCWKKFPAGSTSATNPGN